MSKNKEQLCWGCQRAVGGCPWSTMARPIEGWTAVETKIPNGCSGENTKSYHITACPLFKKDEKRKKAISMGDMISIRALSEILRINSIKLRRLPDDDIIMLATKRGIEIDISNSDRRRIYIRRCKNGSL